MNKKIKIYWAVGATVFVIAVGFSLLYFFNKTTLVGDKTASNPKDATYIIEDQPVTLVAGKSVASIVSSSTKITTQYFGNEATFDLNNDGLLDTAFILTQDKGGSEVFYYVAVALNSSHGYIGTNGVFLGDRIAPQTTEIKNGQVIVNYADRKAGEAMTVNPSVGVSKYLNLVGGKLVETFNPNGNSVIYKNNDYGFTFSLPIDWQGYSIVKGTWEGNALTNKTAPNGPKILIRNPNWTENAHYEDIPILIFTIPQWNDYLAEDFSVSAAPILASELARNNKYVFALPLRWDFDYSLGFKEAEDIILGKPLQGFDI